MDTNGQFLSRINIDKLIYYREDEPSPLNLYPYVGKIKWYDDLQLFIFEEQGEFRDDKYVVDTRIAFTSRDGTFYKPYAAHNWEYEILMGWNSYEKKILVLLASDWPADVGISGYNGLKIVLLDYQTGINSLYPTGVTEELLTPEMFPSCIAFAWAVF